MKGIILCLLVVFYSMNCFAQLNDIKIANEKMHYTKSKVYKIVGYSFLTSGVLLELRGLQLNSRQQRNNPNGCFLCLDGLGEILGGAILTLISVPFIITANSQKHKYLKLADENKKITILNPNRLNNGVQTSITLQYSF